jgi:ABC-type uncharacterized transport system ATPase subunit
MTKDYEYVLSMQHITKIYENGFVANKDVDFSIRKGEIHGLVGENGAGKSTLMKVLFGQEQPEQGAIYLRGEEVKINSPIMALRYGIGMVHQHFMLVPSLTVAENMVFGIEPTKYGFFDYKKAVSMTNEVSQKYGLPIDPNMKIRDLYVGHKQRVEILKMLLRNVEILILDEPTAVLTPQETEELFVQLKNIREKGYTIVFISHKLNEIKEICDRITVMRDGKSINTVDVDKVTEQDISRMMVGRNVIKTIQKSAAKPGEVVLKARHIDYFSKFGKKVLNDISFDIRSGEILGIAGIEGNGQHELSEIITRLDEIQRGEIYINSQSIRGKSIRDVREMKTSHISEDRMTYGIAANATIEDNLISDRFTKKGFSSRGILNRKYIHKFSKGLIENFYIKCDGSDALVNTLSGGNIQKVIAAREFSSEPKFIVCNQPTRGIDIGTSEIIRKKIIEFRDKGAAILLISADITELLEVSDAIIVFNEGEIVAYVANVDEITENELGEYMLGLKKQNKKEIERAIHA